MTSQNAAPSMNLLSLPYDVLFEVLSYASIIDLGNLQCVNSSLYSLIYTNKQFVYFNTLKYFELFYRKKLFAIFLFPYVHPRFSYHLNRSTSTPPSEEDAAYDSDICPGNTAFHIAASNGLKDVIGLFLDNEQSGMRYPSCTGTRYNVEIQKYLTLKPENQTCKLVEMVNDEPNTALHYMSVIPDGVNEDRVVATAALLLKHGADIFRKGRAGNTVLAEAAQHGQDSMVKLFIASFAECAKIAQTTADMATWINTQNDYEENAIILSARNHPSVTKILLEHGGDPNSSRRGFNLIHILCSRFNLDRQDPSALQHYHTQMSSPLRWGSAMARFSDDDEDKWPTKQVTRRQEKTLRYLIKYGADLHAVEASTGMKPLHIASFWGDQGAIETLIEAGVDPNRELNQTNGWLPIHYACSEGQVFAVQTLISAGAHVWDNDHDMYELEEIPEGAELPLLTPKYPFEIDTSSLPLGLHVPSPLELMSFDAMKRKIKKISRKLSENSTP